MSDTCTSEDMAQNNRNERNTFYVKVDRVTLYMRQAKYGTKSETKLFSWENATSFLFILHDLNFTTMKCVVHIDMNSISSCKN